MPVLSLTNRPDGNAVGVALAPVRPSLKPALLNAISLVADLAKSTIVLAPAALKANSLVPSPPVIVVLPSA